jgi:hypothetical protein
MDFETRVLKQLKVIDFDMECRPLSWFGGDFVTKEITAIAWRFLDEKKTHCWTLTHQPTERLFEEAIREGLGLFVGAFEKADIGTGHYVRGFDLPTLNSALAEVGMNVLNSKMIQDTKGDLPKMSGISKSQENLGGLLKLEHEKVQMHQGTWRSANRLTKEGVALSRKRCIGDVEQHIEFREVLLERRLLSPPSRWWPTGGKLPDYQA